MKEKERKKEEGHKWRPIQEDHNIHTGLGGARRLAILYKVSTVNETRRHRGQPHRPNR